MNTTRVRKRAAPHNKGMKQTSVEHIGRSQLIPGVGRTIRVREGGTVIQSLGRKLLAIGLGLSGIGCFFDCPLDNEPKVRVDPTIVGTWRCLGFDAGPDSHPANFIVRQASERRYAIVFDEGDGEVEDYEAYASTVSGQTILNVKVPKPKAGLKPWALARYSYLRPDVVLVQLVDETKLEGADRSPAVLRQTLQKVVGRSDSFGDYCVCVRVKM
jgi:hypothetical protein